jgi:hypothetical protein
VDTAAPRGTLSFHHHLLQAHHSLPLLPFWPRVVGGRGSRGRAAAAQQDALDDVEKVALTWPEVENRCLKRVRRPASGPAARRCKLRSTRIFACRDCPRLTYGCRPCVPSVCPTLRGLVGQFTECDGRIVGSLVAIGSDAAGDGPTVAGDHPAVDAGLVGVTRIEWGPCRPTQKVCSPLRLVSYCTVIMRGSYGPHQLASMLGRPTVRWPLGGETRTRSHAGLAAEVGAVDGLLPAIVIRRH